MKTWNVRFGYIDDHGYLGEWEGRTQGDTKDEALLRAVDRYEWLFQRKPRSIVYWSAMEDDVCENWHDRLKARFTNGKDSRLC